MLEAGVVTDEDICDAARAISPKRQLLMLGVSEFFVANFNSVHMSSSLISGQVLIFLDTV